MPGLRDTITFGVNNEIISVNTLRVHPGLKAGWHHQRVKGIANAFSFAQRHTGVGQIAKNVMKHPATPNG